MRYLHIYSRNINGHDCTCSAVHINDGLSFKDPFGKVRFDSKTAEQAYRNAVDRCVSRLGNSVMVSNYADRDTYTKGIV